MRSSKLNIAILSYGLTNIIIFSIINEVYSKSGVISAYIARRIFLYIKTNHRKAAFDITAS